MGKDSKLTFLHKEKRWSKSNTWRENGKWPSTDRRHQIREVTRGSTYSTESQTPKADPKISCGEKAVRGVIANWQLISPQKNGTWKAMGGCCDRTVKGCQHRYYTLWNTLRTMKTRSDKQNLTKPHGTSQAEGMDHDRKYEDRERIRTTAREKLMGTHKRILTICNDKVKGI